MEVSVEECFGVARGGRDGVLLHLPEHGDRRLPEHPALRVVPGHHAHADAEVAIPGTLRNIPFKQILDMFF